MSSTFRLGMPLSNCPCPPAVARGIAGRVFHAHLDVGRLPRDERLRPGKNGIVPRRRLRIVPSGNGRLCFRKACTATAEGSCALATFLNAALVKARVLSYPRLLRYLRDPIFQSPFTIRNCVEPNFRSAWADAEETPDRAFRVRL